MIDDYSEITQVLELIQTKLSRKNVFISGAAHEYGSFQKTEAESLIYNFSNKLAEKNYKIISGFGLGIGSSVINGTLAYVYDNKKGHLDDYLIMRPFPQNITDSDARKLAWKNYRELMLKEAGIAVFFFGNKFVEGKIVNSDGLIQEFEIALSLGLKVIPVGCTGYVSKDLWDKIMANYDSYFPANADLKESIIALGNADLKEDEIIINLIKAINLLQNQI